MEDCSGMVKVYQGNVEPLRPIALKWQAECNSENLGIDINIETHLDDLQMLVSRERSDLLVLIDGNEVIGYMGIAVIDSPVGEQVMANEHYWYVVPEKRGIASVRLFKAAELWAQVHRCSHILMNASYLASDLHDKVCRLYERFGMEPFETTYIKKV